MNQACKQVDVVLFFFITLKSNAHVQNYDNLKKIEIDIYRNNKLIGKHVFSFNKLENQLEVLSEINFEIKKLGVVLYKYHVKGTEYYQDGKLVKFNSKTEQNGKKKYTNIISQGDELLIDGSSFKGNVPNDYMIGTWWNHSLVKSEAQISAVSGRIIKQKVTFLGKEIIEVNGEKKQTLHFNFSSTDTSLKKDKKLNTDVWYDEKSLNWVKASFDKKGKWEYKLSTLE